MKKGIKILSIILLIIGILMIGFAVVLELSSNKTNKKTKEEIDDNNVENIVKNVYLNKNITKEELNEYFDVSTVLYIIEGKDSFFTYTLPSELSTKYKLSKYEDSRKTYGKKVLDKYISNFQYSEQDNEDDITIELKLYDVGLYLSDVNMLSDKILEKSSLDMQSIVDDAEKYNVYKYEAEVIAMQVLDENINNYEIKTKTYNYLKNNDKKVENYNLYNILISTNNFKESSNEFIDELYNKGIKDKKIDSKDPLKLLNN